MAIEQAMEAQRRLEKESNQHNSLVSAVNIHQRTNEVEEMIYDDDALVINESVNDLNEDSRVRLDRSLSNLETLIKDDQLLINQLLQELNTGRISRNYLQLSHCLPDFKNLCLGHFSRNFSDCDQNQSSLSSIIDPMDHSQIEISNITSSEQFKVGICNSIFLQCYETSHRTFFSNLVVDLYDPNHNKVQFTLKERVKNAKRIVKIEFEPIVNGIHKLTVTYRECHIHGSPFIFYVSLNTSIDTLTINNTLSMDSIPQGKKIL